MSSEEKNPAAVALGRLGGLKRKHWSPTPEQRQELAKRLAKAREVRAANQAMRRQGGAL